MKKQIYTVGFTLLTIVLLISWLKTNGKIPAPEPEMPTVTYHSNDLVSIPPERLNLLSADNGSEQLISNLPSGFPTEVRSGIQTDLLERSRDEWRTPIEFFGKVVDEKTNPVEGVQISFDCNDLSPSGTSFYQTKSDANGLFSIKDIKGKLLNVKANKEGYYAYLPFGKHFFYAGENENFIPSPDSPITFWLRKKGHGAELITSENGMRPDLALRVPPDKTPVRVDLFQKQISSAGQLEISQNKPPFREAVEWSFSMAIPNGGLVETDGEFPFEAPEENYQPSVELHFEKSATNWTTHIKKTYFIAFGQPLKYGWLRVETDLSQQSVFIKYAINPDGSRNLEPK